LKRGFSARYISDQKLTREIVRIFQSSDRQYGRPKIQKELLALGFRVSDKRVWRLMQKARIRPISARRFRVQTTDSNHSLPVSANLLRQNFDAAAPDRIWVSDITYIRTRRGWLYLCIIVDLYSRRIVGWSLRPHMRTSLVLDALSRAMASRKVEPWKLIFHSDRGSQYASRAFRAVLREYRIISSMSRKGNCYDNAVAESTIGLIKKELVYARQFDNLFDAHPEIFRYIEGFYNRKRIHSRLGYVSPEEFELTRSAA
jgi:transposase InsO family protein